MQSYNNAERGLSRVNSQMKQNNALSGIFSSRWTMIGGVVLAAAPLLVRLSGGIVQLTGSLVQAAGGAGVIGGGALGAFIVGIGSVMIVVKGVMNDLKAGQTAFANYNKVVQVYGAQSAQAAAAQRQLNVALKDAPTGTLALLRNVKALGNEWDAATKKARGYVIQTANYAIGRVRDVLPQVGGLVNRNVGAVATQARGMIDRLLDPSNLAILERVSVTFRRDLPPAADAATNLAISFARMIADAGPFVRQFLDMFDRWTVRLDVATRDTEYMRFRMGEMVAEFRNWIGFLGTTVHLLEALFRAATVTHTSLHGITGVFQEWTRWIQENPVKMQRFFANSTQATHDLGAALMFVVRLFGMLGTRLDPIWQSLRLILGGIAGPLLALLTQVAQTLAILGGSLGGLSGPLAIILNGLAGMFHFVNLLLSRIPILGTVLAGALTIVGLYKMVMWMGRFVGLIPRGASEMASLTAATNAAAAATERLALAQRVGGGGIGFVGGGGGGGRVSPGGVILPSGAARGAALGEEAIVAGGAAGLLGRARALPGVLRSGAALRLGSMGLRGIAGPAGIAALIGSTALQMVPSKYVPGGATTQGIAGDVGTGAALGATVGLLGGPFAPISVGVGALIGAAGGGIYGAFSHLSGGGHGADPFLGGTMQRALSSDLSTFGGSNPHTADQLRHQISLYGAYIQQVQARGGQGGDAAAIGALSKQRQLLQAVLPSVRAQERHAAFTGATNLETGLGRGYNVVNAAQGPVAGMEFVRKQALARWAQLGPEGRRVLAQGLLSWADQMRKANPALAGQFEALKNSIIGKFVTIGGAIHLVHGKILTGTKAEWHQIQSAMTTPIEQARELISTQLTIIQQQAVGSLTAMGMTPALAAKIVMGMESHGTVGYGAAQSIAAGSMASRTANTIASGSGFFTGIGPAGGPGSSTSTGTGNLFGLHPGVRGLAGEVMGAFPGLRITSGLRSNDAGSYHSLGEAVDLAGPGMGAAAQWIARRVGGNLLEGIHNGGLSVKNGQTVDPSFWGASTWAAHANHIHLAIGDNSGTSGGGARGWLPQSSVQGSVNTALGLSSVAPGLSGLSGLPGLLTDATGLLVAGGLTSRVNRALRGKSAKTAVRSAGVGASGAQALGQQMAAARGWTGGQWNALSALWTGESGWNPQARNPSSGAFGIPQALPASKMGAAAVGGDAASQIQWGLNYIGGRYGTPTRALSTWQSRSPHWYGDGGRFIAKRPQVIGVGDKGEEEVTIRPLRKRGMGTATGGGIHVTVTIGRIDATGGPGTIREVVRGEIRDAIADVAAELDRTGMVPDEALL